MPCKEQFRDRIANGCNHEIAPNSSRNQRSPDQRQICVSRLACRARLLNEPPCTTVMLSVVETGLMQCQSSCTAAEKARSSEIRPLFQTFNVTDLTMATRVDAALSWLAGLRTDYLFGIWSPAKLLHPWTLTWTTEAGANLSRCRCSILDHTPESFQQLARAHVNYTAGHFKCYAWTPDSSTPFPRLASRPRPDYPQQDHQ